MRDSWFEAKKRRYGTVAFSYLESFESVSDDDEQLIGGSTLKVRIAGALVRSVRANYLKPLDQAFLRLLKRPLARNLYRLLDARRRDPEHLERLSEVYAVGLLEWARECKIVDQTPDKIRRTLDSAHAELLEHGFLVSVEYSGRGKAQQLTYTFQGEASPPLAPAPDSEAVRALLAEGVSPPVARRLHGEFGEAHLLGALARYRALLAEGFTPRKRAALLVDVVRDTTGKYAPPPGAGIPQAAPPRRAAQAPEAPEAPLSHAEQVDAAMDSLRFLLGMHLDRAALEVLRERILSDPASPQRLTQRVFQAKFRGELEGLVQELRGSLAVESL